VHDEVMQWLILLRRFTGAVAGDWQIDRMPAVDRTILGLATSELLARPEVPVAVVIDEAVELATQYAVARSGGFVNGVVAAVARIVRPPDA
jgi:transcription antitermination protein NusB